MPKIREIQLKDNAQIAGLIRSVLIELGVPKVGTAYEDKALDNMFEYYKNSGGTYFALIDGERIIGTAGVGPLEGTTCELQKMYFLPEARGKGFGELMMKSCLEEAKRLGYKHVYIETMPYMEAAQKLYKKSGFHYIDAPMGNTGHYSCPIYMLKEL